MTNHDLASCAASELRSPAQPISPAWLYRHILIGILRRQPGYRAQLKHRYACLHTADEIALAYDTSPAVITLIFAALWTEIARDAACDILPPDVSRRYDPWCAFRRGGVQ